MPKLSCSVILKRSLQLFLRKYRYILYRGLSLKLNLVAFPRFYPYLVHGIHSRITDFCNNLSLLHHSGECKKHNTIHIYKVSYNQYLMYAKSTL